MPGQKKHRFHDGQSGSAIAVHIILKAKENRIEKIAPNGMIWVGMTCQHHDDHLNKELLSFLARVFEVKAGDLELIGGENSVDKWITVIGRNPEQIQAILEKQFNLSSRNRT